MIVVDDGVAIGVSVRASLKGAHEGGAAHVVFATPVAPADVLPTLQQRTDEVVCLAVPAWFGSVGEHYRNFAQTTDGEVIELLKEARGLSPDGVERHGRVGDADKEAGKGGIAKFGVGLAWSGNKGARPGC